MEDRSCPPQQSGMNEHAGRGPEQDSGPFRYGGGARPEQGERPTEARPPALAEHSYWLFRRLVVPQNQGRETNYPPGDGEKAAVRGVGAHDGPFPERIEHFLVAPS